ncbi:MAG TPA: GNAT family N-acetyltransferase [Xanthobacteraceae bacterium]|nr:GNAT family N-acetyltransferase [Xanthobacteraceae bacterium]
MSTIPASHAAPTLETQRLRLRGLKASDLDAFEQMYSDPLVYRLLTGKPLSREDAWARMLRLAGLWELSGYGYWALEDKITGALAGIAGYAEFHRTIEPNIVGKPEFGWALASSFHGRKLSTEAVTAIQAWGDKELGADETSCIIATMNAPSIHLAHKIGFRTVAEGPYNDVPHLVLLRQRP